MYQYSVCGKNFLSDVKLPLEKSCKINADFSLTTKNSSPKIDFKSENILFKSDSIFIKSKTSNIFEIKKNNDILVFSPNEKSKNNIWIEFLGIPLGYILRKNGFNVIHGSSVGYKQSSACIIGLSGQGKSTLALGMIKNKFYFITEDLCVIKDNTIYQISPWVKSTRKVISNLNSDFVKKIEIKNDSRSRDLFRLNDNNCKKKSFPKAFYFPVEGKKSIEKMSKVDSFKFLFTNFYRIHNNKTDDLKRISTLAEEIPCFFFYRDIKDSINANSNYLSSHFKSLIS